MTPEQILGDVLRRSTPSTSARGRGRVRARAGAPARRDRALRHHRQDGQGHRRRRTSGSPSSTSASMDEPRLKRIAVPEDFLVGRTLAHNVVDTETGEILANGERRDHRRAAREAARRRRRPHPDDLHQRPRPGRRTSRRRCASTTPPTRCAAQVAIYRMMRPGEPPTEDAVETLFNGLFFAEERYDLSTVGRMKFNRRVGPLTNARQGPALRSAERGHRRRHQDPASTCATAAARSTTSITSATAACGRVGELAENQFRAGPRPRRAGRGRPGHHVRLCQPRDPGTAARPDLLRPQDPRDADLRPQGRRRRGRQARPRRQEPGDRALRERQAGRRHPDRRSRPSIVDETPDLRRRAQDRRALCPRGAAARAGSRKDTVWHVNPTGKFVVGGPDGDAGLTGRKIIVDTYGGAAPHGGGAFSGKDPTKVDRSAAYAARYLAKNVVAAGLADRATIQLSYAIGVAKPLSIYVDLHGTGKVDEAKLESVLGEVFDLSPARHPHPSRSQQADLRQDLGLRPFRPQARPRRLASRWEKTDLVAALKAAVK